MSTAMPILLILVSLVSVAVMLADSRQRGLLLSAHLFVFSHFLFVVIGYTYFYWNQPNSDLRDLAIAVQTLGLLGFMFGFIVVRAVRRRHDGRRVVSTDSPRSKRTQERLASPVKTGVVSTLILLSATSYFILTGSFPLLLAAQQLLSGGPFSTGLLNTLRVNRDVYINATARYIPMQGLLEGIRYTLVPSVFLVALTARRTYPHYRLIATAVAVFSVLLVTMTGQRWPLLFMLTATLILSMVARRRGVALGSRFLYWMGAGVLLVLTILLARGFDSPTLSLGSASTFGVNDLIQRVFLDQVRVPFLAYNSAVLPKLDHAGGATWLQNAIAFLPGAQPSYPVTFNEIVGTGGGFTAPPDFFLEGYLNLGLAGLPAVGFLWAMALTSLDRFFERSQSLVKAALFAPVLAFAGFSPTGTAFQFFFALSAAAAAWWLVSTPSKTTRTRSHLRPGQATPTVAAPLP